MTKFLFYASTRYVGAERKEVIEIPDYADLYYSAHLIAKTVSLEVISLKGKEE